MNIYVVVAENTEDLGIRNVIAYTDERAAQQHAGDANAAALRLYEEHGHLLMGDPKWFELREQNSPDPDVLFGSCRSSYRVDTLELVT